MSQPAARLGDLTAHGGTVTSGNPTVLINGRPAATLGDMHVCPMCSPGPHVGGPVMVGAPTVLIGGRPAARVGDACTCQAPSPDVIVQGSPNVLIGGASGAVSPGAAAMAASAHGASLAPGTPGTGATARPLSPWVGVGHFDEGARPVAGWRYRAEGGGGDARDGQVGSGGQVWADALAESGDVAVGLVGVYGCRWPRGEARVGDEVGMSARCVGVADGAPAHFEVWREAVAADGSASREKVAEVAGAVQSGRVEAERPFLLGWPQVTGRSTDAPAPTAEPPGGDAPPPPPPNEGEDSAGGSRSGAAASTWYVVEVAVGGLYRASSAPLAFVDWAEIEVQDAEGTPLANATVRVRLGSGEERTLRSGRDGVVRVDGADPGRCVILSITPPRAS